MQLLIWPSHMYRRSGLNCLEFGLLARLVLTWSLRSARNRQPTPWALARKIHSSAARRADSVPYSEVKASTWYAEQNSTHRRDYKFAYAIYIPPSGIVLPHSHRV